MKRAGEPYRWCDAVRIAGGASGECLWPFALATHHLDEDAKSILAALDAQLGNRAGEILLRELVLAVRIWRPEVIIADAPIDGATTVVHEAMKKAFELAANAKAFPEQIDELGLKPWSAKKLYAASQRANDASIVTISTIDPLPRIGDSARDIAQSAAAILHHASTPPNERSFRLVASRLPGAATHSALMQGITFAHGGQARRDQPAVTPTEIDALNERIQFARIRRNIEALAAGDLKGISGPDKLLAQLDAMLKKLPADLGGQAALNVAESFARAGQWPLAREAYMLMLERFPAHPLAIDACRWLIRYHSSSEARRRFELRQFVINANYQVQRTNIEGPKEGVIRQTSRNESVKTEQRTPLATPEVQQWYKPALALESKLAAYGPLFLRDPEFQMCLHSARRSLGDAMAMKKWCERFAAAGSADRDAWCDIAAMEAWLGDRSKKPPRPVGACRFTAKRPHLDGVLDDPCWADAEPLPLQSPSSELHDAWAAQAYFAHDGEFLYIATKCKHPVGRQVAKVEKRTRDMDLHSFDRVGIMLDLDRDYQTYYHLQIDQRGALCEDCWATEPGTRNGTLL